MPGITLAAVLAQLLMAAGNPINPVPVDGSVITVTEHGSAGPVEVRRGQELDVRLGANPTTGYTWRYDPGAVAILRLKSSRFEPGGAQRPPNVGAGGAQVFAFEPVTAGTGDLHFEYRRGPAGAPLRTFDVSVTVLP